tara:strand:- start:495 stop:959 length:465 start_codon:yes stop_codon:yes gene_type:complete
MSDLIVINHAPGSPGLRLMGLGPKLSPVHGLIKLQKLLNDNTSWAKERNNKQIKNMLSNSQVIISVWKYKNLIGFGRATSDGTFRAVLWDIVVEKNYQHLGIGSRIVNSILRHPKIRNVEKIYSMTTHCEEFYSKMGFMKEKNQILMKSVKIKD